MNPKKIILHCSATRDDLDYTIADHEKWNETIRYHWWIRKTGLIEKGLLETEVASEFEKSIEICMVGRNEFTDAQVASLVELYLEIRQRWGIAPNLVLGHSEMTGNKGRGCPNQTMPLVRALLALCY